MFLFFIVIAGILTLPAIALLLLDRRLGGPKLLPHLIANVLYVAWAVFHLKTTKAYAHGPDTWMLILASPLTFAFCYLVVSPRLSPLIEPAFSTFRKVAGGAYLLVFVATMVFG